MYEHNPKAWEPLTEERHAEIWAILRAHGSPDPDTCFECTGDLHIEGMSMQHMIVNGEGFFRPILVLCCNQCGKLVQYNTTLLGIV